MGKGFGYDEYGRQRSNSLKPRTTAEKGGRNLEGIVSASPQGKPAKPRSTWKSIYDLVTSVPTAAKDAVNYSGKRATAFGRGVVDFTQKIPYRSVNAAETTIRGLSFAGGAAYLADAAIAQALNLIDSRDPNVILAALVTGGAAVGAFAYGGKKIAKYTQVVIRKHWKLLWKATMPSKESWWMTAIAAATLSVPTYIAIVDIPIQYDRWWNRPEIVTTIDEHTKREIASKSLETNLPYPLIAELVRATEKDRVRAIYQQQLERFNRDHLPLVLGMYKESPLKDDPRFSIDTIFGIIRAESGVNDFAISPMGAAGGAQFMVETARDYLERCGVARDKILVYEVETKNPKDVKNPIIKKLTRGPTYAAKLREDYARRGSNITQIDNRFDRRTYYCMMFRHLEDLARWNPHEDIRLIEARYNAGTGNVNRAAKKSLTYIGSNEFEAVAPFFFNPEPEKYPWRVEAGAYIRKNSPDGQIRSARELLLPQMRTGKAFESPENRRKEFNIPQEQLGMSAKMKALPAAYRGNYSN